MKLEHIRGNTWAFVSWEWIPFYKLDDRRCILLDTGLADQREDLEEALQKTGLTPVGILCTHAHIDHMGNNAYLKEKYGIEVAMPLGEAGLLSSRTGLTYQNIHQTVMDLDADIYRRDVTMTADRIIMPQDRRFTFCGVEFGILHTSGHTIDHICVRTPDDVLYLSDAVMTGRTLHNSKFPFAVRVKDYFDSMELVRKEKAALYLAAHEGVYTGMDSIVDEAKKVLTDRLRGYLALLDDRTATTQLASRICRLNNIKGKTVADLSYYTLASQAYLNYFREMGVAEVFFEDNRLLYRPTGKPL